MCLAPRLCCDKALASDGNAHIAQLAGKPVESLPAGFGEGKGRILVTVLRWPGFPAAANTTRKFSDYLVYYKHVQCMHTAHAFSLPLSLSTTPPSVSLAHIHIYIYSCRRHKSALLAGLNPVSHAQEESLEH